MNRLFSVLLAGLLLLTVCLFPACENAPNETTSGEPTTADTTTMSEETTTTPTETTTALEKPPIPTEMTLETWLETPNAGKVPGYEHADFGGAAFVIAETTTNMYGYGTDHMHEIYAEGTDPVAVATRTRLDEIEELYHCRIELGIYMNPIDHIKNQTASGVCDVDLYQEKAGTARLSQGGFNVNLLTLGLDLSEPWWNRKYIDAFTIKNDAGADTLYSMTGDFSFHAAEFTNAILFNRDVYDAYVAPYVDTDIYSLIENGEWTLDNMMKMVKLATKEVAGKEYIHYEHGDIVGFVRGPRTAQGFFTASGLTLFETKNGVLTPVIGDHKEAFESLIIDCYRPLTDPNHLLGSDKIDRDALMALSNGKVLFYTEMLHFMTSQPLEHNTATLGVLPYPKTGKNQANYAHFTNNNMPSYAIPRLSRKIAVMDEFFPIFAAHSMKTVFPAWKTDFAETHCKDPRAAEMLDIILSTRTYDPAAHLFPEYQNTLSKDMARNPALDAMSLHRSLLSSYDSIVGRYLEQMNRVIFP